MNWLYMHSTDLWATVDNWLKCNSCVTEWPRYDWPDVLAYASKTRTSTFNSNLYSHTNMARTQCHLHKQIKPHNTAHRLAPPVPLIHTDGCSLVGTSEAFMRAAQTWVRAGWHLGGWEQEAALVYRSSLQLYKGNLQSHYKYHCEL